MKIKDNIMSESIKQLVSATSGVLILLIYSLYSDIIPILAQHLIPNLSKEVLLKITSLAVILAVLLAVLSLFLYLKVREKLIPKFGVLWDKNKEAYCPSCKTYLSEYSERTLQKPPTYLFSCHTCDSLIQLKNLGQPISLHEAQKLL